MQVNWLLFSHDLHSSYLSVKLSFRNSCIVCHFSVTLLLWSLITHSLPHYYYYHHGSLYGHYSGYCFNFAGNIRAIISLIIHAVVIYYLYRPNVNAFFGKWPLSFSISRRGMRLSPSIFGNNVRSGRKICNSHVNYWCVSQIWKQTQKGI
jgi:hypothetical protein